MLTLRHIRRWFEPRLPHIVFIDGMLAGVMQGDELRVNAPAGNYNVRIQCGARLPLGRNGRGIDLFVSGSQQVEVRREGITTVTFHDRERLWNVLFDIDLILWIVSLFVTMPPLYKVLSDSFFAVWLIRLIVIRKRYYKITVV